MISLEQLKQQFLQLQREFYRDRQSRPLSTPWTAQQFRWFKTTELVGATTANMAEADWVERTDDTSKGKLEVYQQNGSLEGEPVGTKGVAAYIDGEWVHVAVAATGSFVTDVRWDDPDLEYSKDGGATWINIDTAEDCS